MSPAEFRCLCEFLGLSHEWVAARLDVGGEEVRRWANGDAAVPEYAANEIASVATMTAKYVHAQSIAHQWGGNITTYSDDSEFRVADPHGLTYPASWHRAVAARVADRCVGVRIVYPARPVGPKVEGIDP